jgi:hypothetical protein
LEHVLEVEQIKQLEILQNGLHCPEVLARYPGLQIWHVVVVAQIVQSGIVARQF